MQIQTLDTSILPETARLLKEDWYLHAEQTRSYDKEKIEERDVVKWLEQRVLVESRFQCFVALDGELVVGAVLYRLQDCMSIAPRPTSLKIEDIVVDQTYRGQGIAKELMKELEKIASKSGVTQLEGDVYSFNQPSRNLFSSLGYAPEYTSYMKIVGTDKLAEQESLPLQAGLSKCKLYADGGSRGNPGPSAGGYVLLDLEDTVVKSNGKYLGITTNNQAEYHSLKGGLEMAKMLGIQEVDVYMDSLLVINQMKGVFKIKNRDLWPIHDAIKKLLPSFRGVTFTHVPRELNKLADAEVNKALDEALA